MPDTPNNTHRPHYRQTYEANGADVELRQNDDTGVFELRMPIASTGDVRNNDDAPLSRDKVDGMARQINDDGLSVGVFVDHGDTTISGRSPYSIAERVGEWQDADITTREDSDEADLLEATARMMDPDSLPDIPVRGHLGTVKELAQRDMAVPASIGWRDDDDAPGGVDLMEASVVGIQADKRTHSEAGAGAVVARAATRAGVDADALVREVRAAVDTETAMTDDTSESADDTDQGEQADDHRADLDETMDRLVDLQEEQMEMLREMMQAMDDGDGDDDEEDDDDEEEQSATGDADAEPAEQSGDGDATDDDRDANDIQEELKALREELDAVREGGISDDDVDVPGNDDEKRDTDNEQADDSGTGDAVKSLIKQ